MQHVQKQPEFPNKIVDPAYTNHIYLAAVVFLGSMLGIILAAVLIFGPKDEAKTNAALVTGAFSAIITPIIGLMLTKKVDAVHVQLNQRMTESENKTAAVEYARGRAEALLEAKLEADALAEVTRQRTADVAETAIAEAEARFPTGGDPIPVEIASVDTTVPVKLVE